MRRHDWSTSPLGNPSIWPESLRAVVAMMINSRYPMFIAWGPQLAFLYNDAYIPILGKRHPHTLALPFRQVWHEIWDDISPLIERALIGEATFSENLHLVIERNGYPEDTWYSFSYSPVRNESDAIAGIFCTCAETTGAVLGDRRQDALLKLDKRLRDVPDTAGLSFAASEILGEVLGAARVGYGAVDPDAGTITVERNWSSPGFSDLAGVHDFANYGSHINDLRRGEAVANDDVEADPRTTEHAAAFLSLGIRAHLDVPVAEGGRTVGQIFVHSANPRVWTASEVSFVREVAERTRAAIARRAAEQELRASEALLSAVVDALPVGVIIAQADGRIVRENDANRALWGVPPETASWEEYGDWVAWWPETGQRIKAEDWGMARALLKGEVINGELVENQRFGTGERRFFLNSAAPVRDPSGRIIAGVVSALDVTTQRAVELRLRESEARYRQIVEGAEDFAIVTLDKRGIITGWNRGAERIVGFSQDEAIGQPNAIFFTPEDLQAGIPACEMKCAAENERAVNERWHLRKDGTRFWGSGLLMRLAGDGAGYLKMFRDRTAEHEAEAVLRRRSEQLQGLAKVATAVSGAETLEATLDVITQAARHIVGVHQGVVSLTRGADWSQAINAVALTAKYDRWRDYAEMPDGSGIYAWLCEQNKVARFTQAELEAHPRWQGFGRHGNDHPPMRGWLAAPLVGRDGRNLGLIQLSDKEDGSQFDDADEAMLVQLAQLASASIEQAQADAALRESAAALAAEVEALSRLQEELRESEARQAFLLSLSDTLRLLRTPTEIVWAAAERLGEQFGLNRVFYAEYFGSLMKLERDWTRGVDSIAGDHDLAAFGPDLLRAYHECPIVKVDDVGTDSRLTETARSGLLARQVGSYLDIVLFEKDQWVSVLALQSATPRAWTSSEEGLFREVGERVRSAVERARAEQSLVELNRTLERRVAEASADLERVWRNASDVFVVIDGEGRFKRVNPAATAVLGWAEGDLLGQSVFDFLHPSDVELTTSALKHARGDALTNFENRYRTNDGNLRTISWVAASEGALIYAYGRDVTAEKERQAELEATQEALRQSQKMEAMGQLTGGVAHDFNNLLTPIVGSLDMLQRKGLGSEREQRLIAGAMQSAERAKTLVQRLLAFARRQPLQAVPVDVAQLVTGMGDLVSSTTGPQIKVIVEAPDDLPAAMADPNQLEMALLNLAVNARDAMPEGGTLRISASAASVNPGHRSNLQAGHYICLSVADDGGGMDEATLARSIEPFFSTKGVGKGTGLGLSMVHGLASQLGGGLTIQSRLGLGTNVELWLPRSVGAPERTTISAESANPSLNLGIALLVDDEELVRMSTADMLSDLGYEVIESGSGEEAMRLVEEGKLFDLLVTDHLMPGITGTDLARAVHKARPGVPVLLVSGYAELGGVDAGLPRLVKPFRKDELAASLAQITNGN